MGPGLPSDAVVIHGHQDHLVIAFLEPSVVLQVVQQIGEVGVAAVVGSESIRTGRHPAATGPDCASPPASRTGTGPCPRVIRSITQASPSWRIPSACADRFSFLFDCAATCTRSRRSNPSAFGRVAIYLATASTFATRAWGSVNMRAMSIFCVRVACMLSTMLPQTAIRMGWRLGPRLALYLAIVHRRSFSAP